MREKLGISIVFIALVLFGCTAAPDTPMETEAESTTLQTEASTSSETNSQWIYAQGPNWKYVTGGNDYFAVYDNEGNEIYYEETHRDPRFTELGNDLLRMDVGGGNMLWLTRFFNVQQGICSPAYENVLCADYGLVVYRVLRDQLVVHDMFDPELNRSLFFCDFRTQRPEDTYPQEVKFLTPNTLFIAYLNSQNELAEETLTLS